MLNHLLCIVVLFVSVFWTGAECAKMLDAEDVMENINKRFDALFNRCDDGTVKPFVCLVCDEFLKPHELEILTLDKLSKAHSILTPSVWNRTTADISTLYTFTENCVEDRNNPDWMNDMLLSPRSSYIKFSDLRKNNGFCVCRKCNYSLTCNEMPRFAIANNYCFGTPPACLVELTEVERALLTPVKSYGYCFSYTGGKCQNLEGSLSYFKVNIESIVKATMHLDVLGLHENIVVIMYGKMTPKQKQRARLNSKVRVGKVLDALSWLLVNNEEWKEKNIDLNEVKSKLRSPVLIDNTTTEAEEDGNVESTETFKVFFPDGTMSATNGGQANLEKFQELVRECKSKGWDLDFQCDLAKEVAADFKDNNLVNACLLQFPYGRGGIHELRKKGDGSLTTSTHIEDYVEHLSRLSQPHFHTELFSLIIYNMNMKQTMVRTAGWKVREKGNAASFAQELTQADVNTALNARCNGTGSYSNSTGNRFVGAIDAVARAVPHTNEASKRGRRDAEAIQHHFGLPHLFLTFAADDQNSFMVQVYSDCKIDDETPIASLTNEQLFQRSKLRNELRIKCPGICAYFYECMLEIVIEEVIGWDIKKEQARSEGGLFGIPIAFTSSTEEQGRKTLHSHFLIWLKNFQERRARMYSQNVREQRSAELDLSDFIDKISSCRLFDQTKFNRGQPSFAFPHECKVEPHLRRLPIVVNDQELRYLRHESGEQACNGRFAYCPHCLHWWTNEELVQSYLICGAKVEGLTQYRDRVQRLKAMAVEYQKSEGTNSLDKPEIIDAGYNHHIHVPRTCFGKSQQRKSKGEKRKSNRECRYRFPQPKRRKTTIENIINEPIKWYSWDGTFSEIYVKEVLMQRHPYDAFQNVSCPAMSQSKLSCNTNIALLMPGPVGQYTFKYNSKDTQKDDTEQYDRVKEACQKSMSLVKKDASETSVAISRLLSASFAHQKTNVVGGAMCSFLTRKESRFWYSHETVWCPLRDLRALLKGEKVTALLNQNNNGSPFYVCSAMNYLCRPIELEDMNAHDFYANYETVKCTRKNSYELMYFHNSTFTHPSFQSSTGKFLQGVRLRSKRLLPKILQFDFPDAAQFGGPLLSPAMLINERMETYSELVLLLFKPYRALEDIQDTSGSFTRKLREVYSNGELSAESQQFLQNIQDAKANSFRAGRPEDLLQRTTEPFMPADTASDQYNDPEDDEDESDPKEGPELDIILDLLGEGPGEADHQEQGCVLPESLNLAPMRQKGVHEAGYSHLAKMKCNPEPNTIAYETTGNTYMDPDDDLETNNMGTQKDPPRKSDLVAILGSRNTRRTYSFADIIKNSQPVNVLEANGSVHSIIDWAKKAKLDKEQRRAFEIFAGTFVLSFYDDAETEIGQANVHRIFKREQKQLRRLVETRKRGSSQLICLLHGPGGCGKTTVIDLLVAYSKEYCSYMDNYEFDKRTIVVTAMTGVAATLLLGETTHTALHLNQRKPIDAEQVSVWRGTRLLIVDEISFASKEDFLLIHKRLQTLKQKLEGMYGGINVIFAGDFRQLEPVGEGKDPVYTQNCPEFKDWTNCFIELKGMHRFKDDPQHGERLLRFRDGTVTKEDITHMNKRVVRDGTQLPDDIKYATYYNRDRDSINAALFEERCKEIYLKNGNTDDTIMIFSDKLEKRIGEKTYTPLKNCKHFWENCGEDHCKPSAFQPRIDPVLRLYTGCRIMLPENSDVSDGKAKGTQATFEKVVLKPGITPRQVLVEGVPVNSVFASEVRHVVLTHCNDRIQPQKFSLEPKEHKFRAQIPLPQEQRHKRQTREAVTMRAFQVPMLINNATTGHKLQGSGVDNIFIHNWSYVQNWPYVMLSRVKTEKGLYMRYPLKRDLSIYAVPKSLQRMLKAFQKRAPSYWNEAAYMRMFGEP